MRGLLLTFIFSHVLSASSAHTDFDKAVECIKRYEGLHTTSNRIYVGYGHRLREGEHFTHPMPERCADSLLRQDLLDKCSVFRHLGVDSVLIGVLAYNVGETRVLKSILVKKLLKGDRDIYNNYISFCRINGEISEALIRRRKEEFELLYNK